MAQPPADNILDISKLLLTALPEKLPPSVKHLDLSNNQLEILPRQLPASLTCLDASGNFLQSIPDDLPESIQELYLFNNRIEKLPTKLPDALVELNVSANKLDALPENLPKTLRFLNIDQNHFTHLPSNLPENLEELFCIGNEIREMPASLPVALKTLLIDDNDLTSLGAVLPATLETLAASLNPLTNFPGNLPETLIHLGLSGCMIGELPAWLPQNLCYLDVNFNNLTSVRDDLPLSLQKIFFQGNRLTRLPENMLTRTELEILDVEDNPFPLSVIEALRSTVEAEDYEGPEIWFSMGSLDAKPLRPLVAAVLDWHPDNYEAAQARWSVFNDDEGAEAFSKFLDALASTVNFRSDNFRAEVRAWLAELAVDTPARQVAFGVSIEATTRCEDKVSLVFNIMQRMRLSRKIEQGKFDNQLAMIVEAARGEFRLQALGEIADCKASTMKLTDKVEIDLSYQVKLRQKLNLPISTDEMRWFDVSGVSEDDLQAAEIAVKKNENSRFPQFLSQWEPWDSALKRIDPKGHAAMKQKLLTEIQDKFDNRLSDYLQDAGLQDDDDARRTAGPSISKAIAFENSHRFTVELLKAKGLGDLLQPHWQ